MTSLPVINCQFSIYKLVLIATLFVLFFQGCSLNYDEPILENEELYPFVDEFLYEGKKRGFKLPESISEIDIRFGDLPEGKGGSCKKLKRLITIDHDIWPLMNGVQKEALVFHELAHCLLDKDHDDSVLPRGECASLMVGGVSDSTCFYDFYSKDWREYYLDELFDNAKEVPLWYNTDGVSNNSNLDSLVLDTITSNYCGLKLQDDWLSKDYQLTIDSFNEDHLLTRVDLDWEYFSLNIDFIEGTFEVESLYGHKTKLWRRVVPRIFHTNGIPKLIDKIDLRKGNGFYDIFLNEEHIYRSSAYSPADFKREHFILHLSGQRKLLNSSVKIHLLQT